MRAMNNHTIANMLRRVESFRACQDRGGNDSSNTDCNGNNGTRLSALEKLRLNLLMQAVRNDDLVYLLVHQVFCAQTLAAQDTARLVSVSRELHGAGLSLLRSFLYDNEMISLRCLQFFAAFPWHFGSPEMQHEIVMSTLARVRHFLQHDFEVCIPRPAHCPALC